MTEFNGVIRNASREPFVPGTSFLTPSMTPHGVVAEAVERVFQLPNERADQPSRLSDDSLWFQFETALPLSLSAWARQAPHRIADWPNVWGSYQTHFDPTRR